MRLTTGYETRKARIEIVNLIDIAFLILVFSEITPKVVGAMHADRIAPIVSYLFALYPLGDGFQVWQLVTYMFMHGSMMHLLFNMLALWMFGMDLENE